VLLEALEDYGGTLIFVSHDRYFVEKLATKIVEVGRGDVVVYPGTYTEFLWHKEHHEAASVAQPAARQQPESRKTGLAKQPDRPKQSTSGGRPDRSLDQQAAEPPKPRPSREERKQEEAERRKRQRAMAALHKRIADLESRIAEREAQVKELESAMAAPGFYADHEASRSVIDRHQALMWEVGDLMAQWEALQEHVAE
jgi:ATP-binding cassette subfamily F protein 3